MYGQRLCMHDSFTLYWRTSSQSMHGAYSASCSQPACPRVTYTVSLPYLVMCRQRQCKHDLFAYRLTGALPANQCTARTAPGVHSSREQKRRVICIGSGALLTNQSSAMVSGDIPETCRLGVRSYVQTDARSQHARNVSSAIMER